MLRAVRAPEPEQSWEWAAKSDCTGARKAFSREKYWSTKSEIARPREQRAASAQAECKMQGKDWGAQGLHVVHDGWIGMRDAPG